MSDNTYTDEQFIAYNNFVNSPSAKTALAFILTCHKYIGVLASKWHGSGLKRKAKINEIITEMTLILLEDFSAGKAIVFKAALSYLDIKLQRLVNPSRKHVFSDIDKISPLDMASTQNEFTVDKLEMVDEIVNIIRNRVLEEDCHGEEITAFLFIHIYPKIHWISELLAKKTNVPAKTRYEADAKRIKRFNNSLREKFNYLESGDWHDILNWSQSERRHLAWRIINISPKEIEQEYIDDLKVVENWRETFEFCEDDYIKNLESAERVYASMNKCLVRDEGKEFMVAEEPEPWGTPPDIISQLIGDFYSESTVVNEPENTYNVSETLPDKPEDDEEFMEVALELSKWFGDMLDKKNRRAAAKCSKW